MKWPIAILTAEATMLELTLLTLFIAGLIFAMRTPRNKARAHRDGSSSGGDAGYYGDSSSSDCGPGDAGGGCDGGGGGD